MIPVMTSRTTRGPRTPVGKQIILTVKSGSASLGLEFDMKS